MSQRGTLACAGMLVAFLWSADSGAAELTGYPTQRPLGAGIPAYKVGQEQDQPKSDDGSPQRLGICKVLQLALANDPALAVRAWEVSALRGRVLQSNLLPNPEVDLELENFGGTDERSGLRSAEATVQLSQLVELGAKRTRRRDVAMAERDIAGWEYEEQRLQAYSEVSIKFYAVANAQMKVELRERQLQLALTVVETVKERVTAGRVTPVEQTRANVEARSATLALRQAQSELAAARSRLASIWGQDERSIGQVAATLDNLMPPPPLDTVLSRLEEGAALGKARAEQTLREQSLRLERANQVPDITLSAGIRRYFDNDESALVAGLSIPIPVFGLNPGGVLEASERIEQGGAVQRDTRLRLRQETFALHAAMRSAYEAALTLQEDILPAARATYEAAQASYAEGRLGLLDVLDAQRTLFDARSGYIESLADYHTARIGMERITGAPIGDLGCSS